jgi:DNA-binding transcriptional MerR regulator
MSQTTTQLLTIGAFSRRSRLSLKALRLYDRLRLLPPAHVDPETGYRFYGESQVETARLIALLRRLRMPLERIGRVIDLPADDAVAELRAFWTEVEQETEVGRRLVAYLERHLEGRGGAMFQTQTRAVAEQQVISMTRALTVEALPDFIMEAFGKLSKHIEAAGGRQRAAFFVIYHGQVNADSDGPVEVCLPFEGSIPPGDGMAVRVEPAHHEAYTTITRGQLSFPGILDAYVAVERWLSDEGFAIGAAPREVYFNESEAAPDDEPFCDIAFPYVTEAEVAAPTGAAEQR